MSASDRHTVGPRPYSTYESTQEHMRIYGVNSRWRTNVHSLHAFMVPGKLYKINTPRGCYRPARRNEFAYLLDLLLHDCKLLNAGTPFMYLGYDTAAQVIETANERYTQHTNANGVAVFRQPSTESLRERAEFIKILPIGNAEEVDVFYVRPIVGDIITEVNMK